MRHVTVVTGPPCAGKSTYVRNHAKDGDVVLDLDAIAHRMGSAKKWGRADVAKLEADEEMWRRAWEIKAMTNGRAWVVRCIPAGSEREKFAKWIGANRVLMLMPPVQILEVRADRSDNRREMRKGLRWFFERYTESDVDEVIRGVSP